MGMFSEIATEGTIRIIVVQIKKELEISKGNHSACAALKKIGRFALTQFEWSAPDWAKEYDQLFKDD